MFDDPKNQDVGRSSNESDYLCSIPNSVHNYYLDLYHEAIVFIRSVGIILCCAACQSTNSAPASNALEGKPYVNALYQFQAVVPDAWKLYGEIANDTINHMAIVDWGLPKVYSDIEKVEIENSVSIAAYRRSDITSVDDMIRYETARTEGTGARWEKDISNAYTRFIHVDAPNGLKYEGKSYFEFQNGIGYVITFMATPGTFEKNIKTFEGFYKAIKYI